MWVLFSGNSLHKRTRNLLIFACSLSLFHCWGIPLLVWNVIFRIPVKCCGPKLQVHPSRHKRLLKARLNAGQHKRRREGGADQSGLQSRFSLWTATPNVTWSQFLSTKITNVCCQDTATIFTNQELEIKGFLEWSIIVSWHTTNQIPLFLLLLGTAMFLEN